MQPLRPAEDVMSSMIQARVVARAMTHREIQSWNHGDEDRDHRMCSPDSDSIPPYHRRIVIGRGGRTSALWIF